MGLCCCSNRKSSAGMFVILMGGAVTAMSTSHAGRNDKDGDEPVKPYVLAHTADRIDGTPTSLETFKGDVILIVNTASKCGLTPQYEGLEALYNANKEDGFVVLGFPANDFMGQEPGTNEEIAEFCTSKFDVSFPMFAKVSVKGKDAHELFTHLTKLSEEPSWNFTKYLIDREGNFVERFGPRTAPDDKKLLAKIDELLTAPRPAAPASE